MPLKTEQLLRKYRRELESVMDGHIKRIILYGSYARDDFNTDSDIDIMILVDLSDSQLRACEKKICSVTYDFNVENDTDIMPVVQNIDLFDHWKNAYMFYYNVEKEGVDI